jgi:hypothetical protein
MQRAGPSPFSLGAVMWNASEDCAEAGQLAVDARAACLGVFVFLQHQDAGAVAQHEAVAVLPTGAKRPRDRRCAWTWPSSRRSRPSRSAS